MGWQILRINTEIALQIFPGRPTSTSTCGGVGGGGGGGEVGEYSTTFWAWVSNVTQEL